jgi:hypothetical protein
MPIPKYDGTPEKEWIASCMHEIGTEYDQTQALAICYKQMETMSEDLAIEDTSQLPEPTEKESQSDYMMRCIPTIYKEGGEYDQRTATAMCADRYQNSNTLLSKEKLSKSPFDRKAEEFQNQITKLYGKVK